MRLSCRSWQRPALWLDEDASLEAEMLKRKMFFELIDWSENQTRSPSRNETGEDRAPGFPKAPTGGDAGERVPGVALRALFRSRNTSKRWRTPAPCRCHCLDRRRDGDQGRQRVIATLGRYDA